MECHVEGAWCTFFLVILNWKGEEVQVLNLAKVGKVKLWVKLVPGLFEDGDENLTLLKVGKVTNRDQSGVFKGHDVNIIMAIKGDPPEGMPPPQEIAGLIRR